MNRALLLAPFALCASCSSPDARPAAVPVASSPSAATSVSAAPAADCAGRTVTVDSVGHVRIGMALDVLRRMCRVVRDTIVKPGDSQPNERRLSFLIGADTVVAMVNAGRIWGLTLVGAGFRTPDSLGVGTPLRRLLAFKGVEGYGLDELIVAVPAHCGLRFSIAGHYADVTAKRDSAILAGLPGDSVVDRIYVDGCEIGEMVADVPDDSTYDVQTDSVALRRDLDGNGVADYVVMETRPFRHDFWHLYRRLAIYRDSLPGDRRAWWATAWDDESTPDLGDVYALGARGSLLMVHGSEADYTSETLLSIRDGAINVEITHGEDYGNGFLELKTEGGALVVDASQDHFLVRGEAITPPLECPNTDWAAVRAHWDEAARRFVPERPRCIKQTSPDDR